MVAMHVSIGMSSAAFMAYLSVGVSVYECMYVRMRIVHVNCSWREKKNNPNLIWSFKKKIILF